MTPPGADGRRRRPSLLLAAAGVAVAAFWGLATPRSAWSAPGPATTDPATAKAAADAPVVVAGIPGLRWSDVDPERTPNLWRLTTESATASMSVRSVYRSACPIDGWLTLGAGRRAAAERSGDSEWFGDDGRCPRLPVPRGAEPSGVTVPLDEYQAYNDRKGYDARLGTLGDSLAAEGLCATAVGPGAALAVADSSGRVSSYAPGGTSLSDIPDRCPLTVVDLGSVREREGVAGTRDVQVRNADARLGELLAEVPHDATLFVLGLADDGTTPHLQVSLARGESYPPGWLYASSTRREGLVQLTDATTSILAALGVPRPGYAVGSAMESHDGRPATADAVADMVDLDTAAQEVGALVPPFFSGLIAAQVLLYLAAGLALRRSWGGPHRRLRVLRTIRVVAIGFAAVPLATFLGNLVPWWRASHPAATLAAVVVAGSLLVAAVAMAGPWRARVLGPLATVSALTALVLGLDVVTGSRLQLSSLMGYSPLVAGRFYGFGNVAFALFATGALLAATSLAGALLGRGRPRAAVGAVLGIGTLTVLVDGLPAWGSDFGGVIALVTGFAVLTMAVTGMRLSALRFAASLLAGVLAVSLIAVLDWLRPAEKRTHLGRFVEDVLDGEALTVVERKLGANLGILTSNLLTLLVILGVLFVVLVLMRSPGWRPAAVDLAQSRAPALRAGLMAVTATLVVGFTVNDSGIAIPGVAFALGVPLLLAASVRALEMEDEQAVSEARAQSPTPAAR